MSSVPRHAVVEIEPEVDHAVVEGQVVLLEPREGRYLSLDDVGSRVWELLKREPRVEAAIQALLGEYDVDETRLRSDVATFLERCEELKLLRVRPGPGDRADGGG